MAINMDFYLTSKYEEINIDDVVRTERLYEYVADERLRYIFAVLHQEINRLIKFMYRKTNFHFNADESRELIYYIDYYDDLKYTLKNTGNAFEIDKEYDSFLNRCKSFLVSSGGSQIPIDLVHIKLKEYEPIFHFTSQIEVPSITENAIYDLRLLGEGSYAKVFKYQDEFYNQNIAVKRANSDLNEKEIERFKREFDVMNSLNSPYVLKVYRYDIRNNEYYMEFVDQTLYDYIRFNNKKISTSERFNIIMQILKGFQYIHSKKILHRDISLTNILVKKYDDNIIIKIADFGLVKEKDSNLTSLESEIKGSLNDESNLRVVGFSKYNMYHETFALTRLILYVLTGKTNLDKVEDKYIRDFVLKGTNGDVDKRYKDVDTVISAVKDLFNKIKV